MVLATNEVKSDNRLEELKDEIQKNTALQLEDFNSMEDVFSYVDAIVSSGSSEEAKGSVYVLGNTYVGKSSLVKTLQKYCEDVNKDPKPVLTGDGPERATRVLDLGDPVQLHLKIQTKLTISPENSHPRIIADSNNNEPTSETALENIRISFVDFGGHTEYASCSPIFIKEKGVFLICFLASQFKDAQSLKDEFFPSIGTYIELITENCQEPIIFLVATQVDHVGEPSLKDRLSSVLQAAQEHLNMIAKRSNSKKPFIFHRVYESTLVNDLTSPDKLKSLLDNLMSNLVAVFGHADLMGVELKAVPKSWRKTVETWKEKYLKVSLENAVADFLSLMKTDPDWMSRAPDEQITENLDGWKTAAEELVNYAKEEKYSVEEERPTADSIEDEDEEDENQPEDSDDQVTEVTETKADSSGVGEKSQRIREKQIISGEASKARKCFNGFLNLFSKTRPTEESESTDMEDIQGNPHPNETEEEAEARKLVRRILTFFSSGNEILWFR